MRELIEAFDAFSERLEKILDKKIEREEGVLLSCTESARLLGVTKKTISEMIKSGRLHKVTIGSSTGIRYSEVSANPKFKYNPQ